MHHRGRLTFEFIETKEKALQFVKSRRLRKYTITQWESTDHKQDLFVIWFYVW